MEGDLHLGDSSSLAVWALSAFVLSGSLLPESVVAGSRARSSISDELLRLAHKPPPTTNGGLGESSSPADEASAAPSEHIIYTTLL